MLLKIFDRIFSKRFLRTESVHIFTKNIKNAQKVAGIKK